MKATITRIESRDGLTTVDLEWGGPDDTRIWDYDLGRLAKSGKVSTSGMNGNASRSGWVIFWGECNLAVGDSVPRLPEES